MGLGCVHVDAFITDIETEVQKSVEVSCLANTLAIQLQHYN